jgi:hypothetical protein
MNNKSCNKITINKLMILSICFFPLQIFSLPLAQSRYDITAFLLLFVAVYYTFKNQRVKFTTLYIFLFFLCIQFLVLFVLQVPPIHRFFSGIVWFGGLLLVFLSGVKAKYNQKDAFNYIIITLLITSLICFFQFFLLGIDRPSAFFNEPSFAGLALFSASAGCFSILMLSKSKKRLKFLIFFLIFLVAGLMTKSMHIITFFIVVLMIFYLKMSFKLKKISINKIIYTFVFCSVLIFCAKIIYTDQHFISRLNLFNPGDNLSLLSWLRGFDQMASSIINSPLLGNGLGSTGFIDFNSPHSDALSRFGMESLNLTDAYSLAFRLVIEIGLPFFILFLIKWTPCQDRFE